MTDTLNQERNRLISFARENHDWSQDWQKGVEDAFAIAGNFLKRSEIPVVDEKALRKSIASELTRCAETAESHDWNDQTHRQRMVNAVILGLRPHLRAPKREVVAAPEHAKTKDLVNMIRMKLERRFQTSDHLADGGDRDGEGAVRSAITDVCQDVMAHVREIHALAERALNSIEGGQS